MSGPVKDERPRCVHHVVYPMDETGCAVCLHAEVLRLREEVASLLDRIALYESGEFPVVLP
jgi:hypothetical protein